MTTPAPPIPPVRAGPSNRFPANGRDTPPGDEVGPAPGTSDNAAGRGQPTLSTMRNRAAPLSMRS